jgi:hypothetical protein
MFTAVPMEDFGNQLHHQVLANKIKAKEIDHGCKSLGNFNNCCTQYEGTPTKA